MKKDAGKKPSSTKPAKKTRGRAGGRRKKKDKAEAVPKLDPKQIFEEAMRGVNYA